MLSYLRFFIAMEEKRIIKKATHIHSVAAHARKERLELPTPGFERPVLYRLSYFRIAGAKVV